MKKSHDFLLKATQSEISYGILLTSANFVFAKILLTNYGPKCY